MRCRPPRSGPEIGTRTPFHTRVVHRGLECAMRRACSIVSLHNSFPRRCRPPRRASYFTCMPRPRRRSQSRQFAVQTHRRAGPRNECVFPGPRWRPLGVRRLPAISVRTPAPAQTGSGARGSPLFEWPRPSRRCARENNQLAVCEVRVIEDVEGLCTELQISRAPSEASRRYCHSLERIEQMLRHLVRVQAPPPGPATPSGLPSGAIVPTFKLADLNGRLKKLEQ